MEITDENQQKKLPPLLQPSKTTRTKKNIITLISTALLLFLTGGLYVVSKLDFSDLRHRYFYAESQKTPKIERCDQNSDCILVQSGWCGTILSINSAYKSWWEKHDQEETAKAKKDRSTCKPTLKEYIDINNFSAKCEDSACKAKFKERVAFADFISLSNVWSLGTKTYSNPKIDILINYPSSFIINEVDTVKENNLFRQKYPEIETVSYGSFFVSFHTPEASVTARQKEDFDWVTYDHNTMMIGVDVYDNKNGVSLEDFLKDHYGPETAMGPLYEILKPGLKPSNSPKAGSYVHIGSLGENPQKHIFFSHKERFYIFTMSGGNDTGAEYSPEAEKIFDQMITSIQFL